MSNSLDPEQADVLLGLIWVQTVCKGYQQMLLVGKELGQLMRFCTYRFKDTPMAVCIRFFSMNKWINELLHGRKIFMIFRRLIKKIISVKQSGPRSGLMFCPA